MMCGGRSIPFARTSQLDWIWALRIDGILIQNAGRIATAWIKERHSSTSKHSERISEHTQWVQTGAGNPLCPHLDKTTFIYKLWQAELTFIPICWYEEFEFLISTIRIVDISLLVLVGLWTGKLIGFSSASIYPLHSCDRSLVGVLETIDRLCTHNFRWKTIPPVDHTLAEEMFSRIYLGLSLVSFIPCPLKPWWFCASWKNCLLSIFSLPVNNLYTSVMSPLSLLSFRDVIPNFCSLTG